MTFSEESHRSAGMRFRSPSGGGMPPRTLVLHRRYLSVCDKPHVFILFRAVWDSKDCYSHRRSRFSLSLHEIVIDDRLSADAETVFHAFAWTRTNDVIDTELFQFRDNVNLIEAAVKIDVSERDVLLGSL